jgi:AcrR family transcriptional regulator
MSPSAEKARVILDAASAVLAEQGFAHTTVNEVAARAGVSRGLLHYYFANKEEMLARVVQSKMDKTTHVVGFLFADSRDAAEVAQRLVTGLRQILDETPGLFHLLFEAWVIARQSEVVAEEFRAMYRRFRKALETGLADASERGVVTTDQPLHGVAAVLTAIIDGLGLQLVTEPALIEDEGIWEAAQAAIERALSGG